VELTHLLERLEAARQHLDRKLADAKAREERERLEAQHAEAVANRDAAAQALKRYPAFAAEIASILAQVQASNAEVEAVNRHGGGPWIEPAEAVARGMAANSIHWLLTGVVLPSFDHREHVMARSIWPPGESAKRSASGGPRTTRTPPASGYRSRMSHRSSLNRQSTDGAPA